MLVSIWKIVAFLISTILILHIKGENVGHLFTMLSSAFGEHKITVTSVKSFSIGTLPDVSEILTGDITEVINADFNTPIYVLLLQIAGAYFAYVFGEREREKQKEREHFKYFTASVGLVLFQFSLLHLVIFRCQ